jgi:solute carrier family 25 carnitine/acylcarnitine transporter 20/29
MPLSDAWIDFAAGWCSGGAAVLACQPFDTVLTRWQAGIVQVQAAGALGRDARALTQTAGWTALWRGASPMIGAVPLQNALLMGGYGVGQQYAEHYQPDWRKTAIFVGGCTGGLLQSFLMSPVELVKVAQQCAGQSLTTASRHVTTTSAWRGLGATLVRDGIPHGVWFVAYEECKDLMLASWKVSPADDYDDTAAAPLPVVVPLVSGAVAATTAWAVGYPADVIKTRIQAAASLSTSSSSAPLGIFETARLLIAEANGNVWKGLYRGFGLKLVRSVPASMIGFTVYEWVKGQVVQVV